jgi:hypothetical protein
LDAHSPDVIYVLKLISGMHKLTKAWQQGQLPTNKFKESIFDRVLELELKINEVPDSYDPVADKSHPAYHKVSHKG